MKSLCKVKISNVSKLFLFILICSLNIREPFLHTRELSLFFVLLTSLSFVDYAKISYSLLLMIIGAISTSYNLLAGCNLGNGFLDPYIGGIYLFIMCFVNKTYKDTIIKAYLFSSYLVAIATITIWILCFLSPLFYNSLKFFFDFLELKRNLMWCHIDWRFILGIKFMTVYFRTSPCLVCSLAFLLVRKLNSKKQSYVWIILLTIALFFTGARANMLATFLLLFAFLFLEILKEKYFTLGFFLLVICIFTAVTFAILFLTDNGSTSNNIKSNDFRCYLDLFEKDYFRTVFFGWGAGSYFYSWGRLEFVNITELSFFETIRRYGFISTVILLFYYWGWQPIKKIYRGSDLSKYFYIFPIISYMLIAFTNPFLIDSFGFCSLMFTKTYYDYED